MTTKPNGWLLRLIASTALLALVAMQARSSVQISDLLEITARLDVRGEILTTEIMLIRGVASAGHGGWGQRVR